MMKTSLNEAIWILGIIAGTVCIVFALFSFVGHVSEIFDHPVQGFTGMVSAGVLSIMGLLIVGTARMTRNGGHLTTTGGIRMLIFGFVAYMTGGGLGASLALLTGLLVIIIRYI